MYSVCFSDQFAMHPQSSHFCSSQVRSASATTSGSLASKWIGSSLCLLSYGDDGFVRLWDVGSGLQMREFRLPIARTKSELRCNATLNFDNSLIYVPDELTNATLVLVRHCSLDLKIQRLTDCAFSGCCNWRDSSTTAVPQEACAQRCCFSL